MSQVSWAALRFAAGAAAALGAAWAVSEAVDPVYPRLTAALAQFRRDTPGVRVVTVGNSHAGAIDLAVLGREGTHLWNHGQDALEAVRLARHAADGAPRLRYVLLTASPGFEWANNAVVGSRDRTGLRRELYARLPGPPIGGDFSLWVRGRLAPVVRPDHWRGVVRRAVRGPRPAPPAAGTAPPGRLAPDSLARTGASAALRHDATRAEMRELAPGTARRAASDLEDLAGFLAARGVTLLLYTPPYHESYLRSGDPAVAEGSRALARALAGRHCNVVWLDFSDDPRFTGRVDLFLDGDHLNRDGALRFSALLGTCLRALEAGRPVAAGPGGCGKPASDRRAGALESERARRVHRRGGARDGVLSGKE